MKRESRGVFPDIMSCSRVMYGQCSRCGTVGKTHFERARRQNSEEQERKQIQHTFFSAKRKYITAPAQLKFDY